jgi:hypothetical protein
MYLVQPPVQGELLSHFLLRMAFSNAITFPHCVKLISSLRWILGVDFTIAKAGSCAAVK